VETYFCLNEQTGLVKIGRSKAPKKRIRDLETAAGVPLRLVLTFSGNRELEFHRQFSHCRSNGEWFRLHADLLDFLLSQDSLSCEAREDLRGLTRVSARPTASLTPESESRFWFDGVAYRSSEGELDLERLCDGAGSAYADDHCVEGDCGECDWCIWSEEIQILEENQFVQAVHWRVAEGVLFLDGLPLSRLSSRRWWNEYRSVCQTAVNLDPIGFWWYVVLRLRWEQQPIIVSPYWAFYEGRRDGDFSPYLQEAANQQRGHCDMEIFRDWFSSEFSTASASA
jgi:hypothetical protein